MHKQYSNILFVQHNSTPGMHKALGFPYTAVESTVFLYTKVNTLMSERIAAGHAADLMPGESIQLKTDQDMISVFNVDGTFYATSNICPHAQAPLHEGFIEDGRITCPWHGWSFPLTCEYTDRDGLWRYRVIEENGELFIEIPAVNA
jgi:nitrite reductase (NADH) small subunit